MKRNRKYNLLGWLAVSMLLMTTACSDHADLEAGALQGDPNGTNTVTFTIQPETQSVGRRAGVEDNAENKIPSISDGTKVDLLIFAVYEYKNGKWVLAEELKGKNTTDIEDLQLGDKQYALKVEGFPVKFQLTLNSGTIYKVAFWAQNSGCKAYDTHDLQAVEVKYENALNNDELRDAFCTTTKEFDGGIVDEPIKATLHRPLAQINIGTTGWDYEGAAYLKPSPVSYTHSQVTLEGVARYYNVLDGKAIVDDTDHKTTNVTFGYAKIPAFINVTDEEWKAAEHLYLPFENEEYLKVKLYEDEGYKKYVGWEDYDKFRKENSADFAAGKLPETETFKYLSMCYVLVPEAGSITDINNVNYGSVLDAVIFETKGIDEEDPNKDKESTPKQVFEIKNVPVQKNWRTNILGNSFFVYNNKFIVDIVPDYCGDYNNIGGTENDWQNGRTGNEEDGWQYKGNPNTDFDDHDYNDPKGN